MPESGASGLFDGNSATVTVFANPNGVAATPRIQANYKAGSFDVLATDLLTGASVDFYLTSAPGPASKIATAIGTMSTEVATPYQHPLQVALTDQYGNPISGASINFIAPISGPSVVFGASGPVAVEQTSASGTASVAATAGDVAGPFSVTASILGLSVQATFLLTNTPGPPARVSAAIGQSQSTRVLAPYAVPIGATVTDEFGNPLSGQVVDFIAPKAGASATFGRFLSVSAMTNYSGVAEAMPVAGAVAGNYAILAQIAPAISVSIPEVNRPGPPATMATLSGSAQSAVVGTDFGRPLEVLITDNLGNPVPGTTVNFTMPGTGPGATLGGAGIVSERSDDNGIASSGIPMANDQPGQYLAIASISGISHTATFAMQNLPDNGTGITASDADRFLDQSGFGPSPQAVVDVTQNGYQHYLDEQFAEPASQYPIISGNEVWDTTAVQQAFFVNALKGADQLRQRVSLALSEIFVVSWVGGKVPEQGIASFMNLLQSEAFGNFFDLLHDVSLSSAMGMYLDIAGNQKADMATGTKPNENYARELMQLFTIGVVQLQPDGTPTRGADGVPVPSYTQQDVDGNAAVLTGWVQSRDQTGNFTWAPMIADEQYHDVGPKDIVGGQELTAGSSAEQDLNSLLQSLFNNANTGPFICKQLIQHLVTSNPSPDYVERVASIFDDDGTGVRGNLKAVLSAILLDPEARLGTDGASSSTFGKMSEPQVYIATLLRELNATSDGLAPMEASLAMGQPPFGPPSVFGFFQPSQSIVTDSGVITAPEFSLDNLVSEIQRQAFVHKLILGGFAPATSIDLAQFDSSAQAGGAALANQLDKLLTCETLPVPVKNEIAAVVDEIPATNLAARIANAVELIATSPYYYVQH